MTGMGKGTLKEIMQSPLFPQGKIDEKLIKILTKPTMNAVVKM